MDILQNHKRSTFLQSRQGVEIWGNNILLLYIFTMPFISAFAFSPTISLPLLFALTLFIVMVVETIRTLKLPLEFIGFDLVILFTFLFFVVFSFAINGLGNTLSFNHTLAYLSSFLLFYVAIKFIFFNAKNKVMLFRRALQLISFTTIISAVYANAEFILSNFFDIDLNEFIPRSSEAEVSYRPKVIQLFYRARGFSTESGHFTFMMELFSPLVIYYMYFSGFCKWPSLVKAFVVILIILSFIFAVSSASFLILPVAIFLASLVHLKKIFLYFKRQRIKFFITSGVVFGVVLIINYLFSFYALILLSISDKMDSNSLDDRQARINFFYNNFFHFDLVKKIVGAGPAGFDVLGYDESKAILSLYYSVTFELGLVGLFLLSFFLINIIFHALQIKSNIGFFLLISLISGIFHYYFIANFWYPWFWFIAAFIMFCSKIFTNTDSESNLFT